MARPISFPIYIYIIFVGIKLLWQWPWTPRQVFWFFHAEVIYAYKVCLFSRLAAGQIEVGGANVNAEILGLVLGPERDYEDARFHGRFEHL